MFPIVIELLIDILQFNHDVSLKLKNYLFYFYKHLLSMTSEVIISRLDELIGEYDTPFFKYLLYSYDFSLEECELVISKIRNDISDGKISGDDNLVEVIQDYFTEMWHVKEKRSKLEYLGQLMDESSEFYLKYLSGYEVSPRDMDIIYTRLERQITEDNISDFEIKRGLEYYFSNAVKQGSYIKSLEMIVGKTMTLWL